MLLYLQIINDSFAITLAKPTHCETIEINGTQDMLDNQSMYILNDCKDGVVLDESDESVCKEIERCRRNKSAEIRSECESHINAGFIADILFPDSNYRNDRDQQQKMREAAESTSGGYIYVNERLEKHTQSQAQQIYSLSKSTKELCFIRNDAKQQYLQNPSRTTEEITAVTWDSVE